MTWKDELKRNVRSVEDIMEYIWLSDEEQESMRGILSRYPMSVTRYYLSLVDWEHYETDPIFRLAVPSLAETDMSGTFDTSGEKSNTRFTGLQHKYRQTALVLTTNECAMYCRHCFRKRLVGLSSQKETTSMIDKVADYVRDHDTVNNVLLSGGDSFLQDNEEIERYLALLTQIEHVDLIRFGTRTPVTFPQRINQDPELIEILREYNRKKQIYVITHFNHPGEITKESRQAVCLLKKAGLIIRNQTVLLRGINDNPDVLGSLLGRLTSIGVIPYYIFQCRPVTGVKNQFQLPIRKGYEIVEAAKNMQNGQGKCIRYVMSHPRGKIEIVGPADEKRFIMKFHQAKYEEDAGRIFLAELDDKICWLGEL